ncbi:60S acidic ribosomal protein P2 [Planoprotostelium fungivorum]|uniref:60S acidic ribosomal protein P2 n=1 Tax=Planoprotostelium fungivorum TaxID=1890364 RepID=A0A2P6N6P3_9EUKA|nr:60S acidic ribosomal protein P2 [Planoprotostelium fungivorum]
MMVLQEFGATQSIFDNSAPVIRVLLKVLSPYDDHSIGDLVSVGGGSQEFGFRTDPKWWWRFLWTGAFYRYGLCLKGDPRYDISSLLWLSAFVVAALKVSTVKCLAVVRLIDILDLFSWSVIQMHGHQPEKPNHLVSFTPNHFFATKQTKDKNMKNLAAYLLAILGGNQNPTVQDIQHILSSVGIEHDQKRSEELVEQMRGKDLQTVMMEGMDKMAKPVMVAAPAAQAEAPRADDRPPDRDDVVADLNINSVDDDEDFGSLFD